jgi:hypothetical protein
MGFLGLENDGARPCGRAGDGRDIGSFADKWNVIRRARSLLACRTGQIFS